MANSLSIKVIKPGLYTTIQDQGRVGYQRFGVPFSGPMSPMDAGAANRIVGNELTNPTMEITLMGPLLQLDGKGCIALTGAPIEVFLDNQKVPMYKSLEINGSRILSFGKMESGYRSYLSVRGNWELTPWLNSVSAAPGSSGHFIPTSQLNKDQQFQVHSDGMYSMASPPPSVDSTNNVRIMAGPEYQIFEPHQIRYFLNQKFQVSSQANRMGLRLVEKLPAYLPQGEVISSGIVPGTIQITNEGQPIILTADAQTSGGYPRIANVLSDDFGRLAQLRPGAQVGFSLTSITDILKKQHHAG
jgi:antagonist of KipI